MTTEGEQPARPTPSPLRRLVRARHHAPGLAPAIGVLAVAAAVADAVAGAHPSGLAAADPVLCGAVGAATVVAGSRSRRSASIVAAALAGVFATGTWQVVAVVAIVLAGLSASMAHRSRLLGTVVAALVAPVLIRLPTSSFHVLDHHGFTAVVGLVATGVLGVSGYQRADLGERLFFRRLGVVLAGVVVVATGPLLVSVLLSTHDINAGLDASRRGLRDARAANTKVAAAEFRTAEQRLDRAHGLLGGWWLLPARAVPVVGQHAQALAVVSDHAVKLARAAHDAASTGNYHDLRYRSGRFDLGLMLRLRAPLTATTEALVAADGAVQHLRTGWLLAPLRSKLDTFTAQVRDAEPDARLASDAVRVAPGVFGDQGDRRYLVLFTTPAEQRGLGGFIGAYGELTASGGRLRLTRSGPIDDLIEAVPRGRRVLHAPPDYVRRYGPFQPQDYLQDLTLSPDFPSVASVAADLYRQSVGRRVDGVVMLDPFGLAALLKLTGPVPVEGLDVPLTAAGAPTLLLRDQHLRYQRGSSRQDLLQNALKATFRALTKATLPGPQALGDSLGPAVHEGRLMLWMHDREEQAVVRTIGAEGALARPDGGDFLSVRAQNSAHNKIDAYLDRSITDDVTVDPSTGFVQAEVTVRLHNGAPTSGAPAYVIGNTADLPEGSNRMTLSVYSPLPGASATINGFNTGIGPATELGWNVSSVSVIVPAGQTTVVVFHLQGQLDLRNGYHLQVVPQPAALPAQVTFSLHTRGGYQASVVQGLRGQGSSLSGSSPLTRPVRFAAGLRRAG